MFCHGCLTRYVRACLVAFLLAQASVAAWIAGDIPAAYVHAHNFAAVWRALQF